MLWDIVLKAPALHFLLPAPPPRLGAAGGPRARTDRGQGKAGHLRVLNGPGLPLPLVGKAVKLPEQWSVMMGHTCEGLPVVTKGKDTLKKTNKQTSTEGVFLCRAWQVSPSPWGTHAPTGTPASKPQGYSSPIWLHGAESGMLLLQADVLLTPLLGVVRVPLGAAAAAQSQALPGEA